LNHDPGEFYARDASELVEPTMQVIPGEEGKV
jgi:hypothetical protein